MGQTISTSPYSVYGVGLTKKKTSSLNRSFSNTGIGLRDTANFSSMNPASYASVNGPTQMFEIGTYYEMNRVQTTDLSEVYTSANLNALNLWFRFSKKWAALVGLSPYSSVNYNIVTRENLPSGGTSTNNYKGNGSLAQFYIGNGFQVTKNLSVGVNASYIFGTLKKRESIILATSQTTLERRIFAHRLHADFGIQYTFFLPENRQLIFGAVYEPQLRLKTTSNKLFYQETNLDTLLSEDESINNYIIPQKVGVGASFQTVRSNFLVDLSFEEWAQARLEDNLETRNIMRVSAAYEYKGNPNSARYLDLVRLRSGVYFQQNYLVLRNTPYNEWGFTVGLGLPINYGRATLGISYNYNNSGTTENSLIKQQASVIVLDVTVRDLWGIKRRFD